MPRPMPVVLHLTHPNGFNEESVTLCFADGTYKTVYNAFGWHTEPPFIINPDHTVTFTTDDVREFDYEDCSAHIIQSTNQETLDELAAVVRWVSKWEDK